MIILLDYDDYDFIEKTLHTNHALPFIKIELDVSGLIKYLEELEIMAGIACSVVFFDFCTFERTTLNSILLYAASV